MRLAVLQERSVEGDLDAGLAKAEAALSAAGAMGASALVMPECWLPGYNHSAIAVAALPRDGEWRARLATACRKGSCGLVLGYVERDGAELYNSALALDASGQEVAH